MAETARTSARVLRRGEIRSLLSKPTWTVNDLVQHSAPLRNPPTEADVARISQLASLERPTPKMMAAFINQLKFVEVLRDVDTSGVEPIARLVDNVSVPDLTNALEITETAPELGKWRPVDLAAEKESDFYVVKDSLHGQQQH